ncbi:MAG TPA: hypothetical protein PLZ51_00615, partial [Aggregatilineales bacterium]|nr:hypothetical protein [Aggregatilineales bacterium]
FYSLYATRYAQIWIFADIQYAPQNYAHPILDYATFHTTSQESANIYVFNYVQGRATSASYSNAINEFASQYDAFFVTEYATPTDAITVSNDPVLRDLTARFAYMTSLQGR